MIHIVLSDRVGRWLDRLGISRLLCLLGYHDEGTHVGYRRGVPVYECRRCGCVGTQSVGPLQ